MLNPIRSSVGRPNVELKFHDETKRVSKKFDVWLCHRLNEFGSFNTFFPSN